MPTTPTTFSQPLIMRVHVPKEVSPSYISELKAVFPKDSRLTLEVHPYSTQSATPQLKAPKTSSSRINALKKVKTGVLTALVIADVYLSYAHFKTEKNTFLSAASASSVMASVNFALAKVYKRGWKYAFISVGEIVGVSLNAPAAAAATTGIAIGVTVGELASLAVDVGGVEYLRKFYPTASFVAVPLITSLDKINQNVLTPGLHEISHAAQSWLDYLSGSEPSHKAPSFDGSPIHFSMLDAWDRVPAFDSLSPPKPKDFDISSLGPSTQMIYAKSLGFKIPFIMPPMEMLASLAKANNGQIILPPPVPDHYQYNLRPQMHINLGPWKNVRPVASDGSIGLMGTVDDNGAKLSLNAEMTAAGLTISIRLCIKALSTLKWVAPCGVALGIASTFYYLYSSKYEKRINNDITQAEHDLSAQAARGDALSNSLQADHPDFDKIGKQLDRMILEAEANIQKNSARRNEAHSYGNKELEASYTSLMKAQQQEWSNLKGLKKELAEFKATVDENLDAEARIKKHNEFQEKIKSQPHLGLLGKAYAAYALEIPLDWIDRGFYGKSAELIKKMSGVGLTSELATLNRAHYGQISAVLSPFILTELSKHAMHSKSWWFRNVVWGLQEGFATTSLFAPDALIHAYDQAWGDLTDQCYANATCMVALQLALRHVSPHHISARLPRQYQAAFNATWHMTPLGIQSYYLGSALRLQYLRPDALLASTLLSAGSIATIAYQLLAVPYATGHLFNHDGTVSISDRRHQHIEYASSLCSGLFAGASLYGLLVSPHMTMAFLAAASIASCLWSWWNPSYADIRCMNSAIENMQTFYQALSLNRSSATRPVYISYADEVGAKLNKRVQQGAMSLLHHQKDVTTLYTPKMTHYWIADSAPSIHTEEVTQCFHQELADLSATQGELIKVPNESVQAYREKLTPIISDIDYRVTVRMNRCDKMLWVRNLFCAKVKYGTKPPKHLQTEIEAGSTLYVRQSGEGFALYFRRKNTEDTFEVHHETLSGDSVISHDLFDWGAATDGKTRTLDLAKTQLFVQDTAIATIANSGFRYNLNLISGKLSQKHHGWSYNTNDSHETNQIRLHTRTFTLEHRLLNKEYSYVLAHTNTEKANGKNAGYTINDSRFPCKYAWGLLAIRLRTLILSTEHVLQFRQEFQKHKAHMETHAPTEWGHVLTQLKACMGNYLYTLILKLSQEMEAIDPNMMAEIRTNADRYTGYICERHEGLGYLYDPGMLDDEQRLHHAIMLQKWLPLLSPDPKNKLKHFIKRCIENIEDAPSLFELERDRCIGLLADLSDEAYNSLLGRLLIKQQDSERFNMIITCVNSGNINRANTLLAQYPENKADKGVLSAYITFYNAKHASTLTPSLIDDTLKVLLSLGEGEKPDVYWKFMHDVLIEKTNTLNEHQDNTTAAQERAATFAALKLSIHRLCDFGKKYDQSALRRSIEQVEQYLQGMKNICDKQFIFQEIGDRIGAFLAPNRSVDPTVEMNWLQRHLCPKSGVRAFASVFFKEMAKDSRAHTGPAFGNVK